MNETLTRLEQFAVEQLPKTILPVVILIGGWLVALILGGVAKRAVQRIARSAKVADLVRGSERATKVNASEWAGRTVYYIALLVVFVGFFQTLGLTAVTKPLNAFLESVFGFAPRIAAAAVILVASWLLATLARGAVVVVLERASWMRHLDQQTDGDEEATPSVVGMLGGISYWLTLLLFVPAVLGTLGLDGLLEPVQGMLDKILAFLPNVASAAVIFIVGWVVAGLVQKVLTNLLGAAGTDELSSRFGLDRALGKSTTSTFLGWLAKILIIVPVSVAALNALKLDAITKPASRMLEMLLEAIPSLFAATLVLVLSLLVGRAVAGALSKVLADFGFDSILVKLGLAETAEAKRTPSAIIGGLTVVSVMVFASMIAAELLSFEMAATTIRELMTLGGQVLLGLGIFALGLYLAHLAADSIGKSSIGSAKVLATISRVSIISLVGAMALRQMGFANEIIHMAFGLILGAIVLAAALAFGIGGREEAAKTLSEWRKRIEAGGK